MIRGATTSPGSSTPLSVSGVSVMSSPAGGRLTGQRRVAATGPWGDPAARTLERPHPAVAKQQSPTSGRPTVCAALPTSLRRLRGELSGSGRRDCPTPQAMRPRVGPPLPPPAGLGARPTVYTSAQVHASVPTRRVPPSCRTGPVVGYRQREGDGSGDASAAMKRRQPGRRRSPRDAPAAIRVGPRDRIAHLRGWREGRRAGLPAPRGTGGDPARGPSSAPPVEPA